MKMYASENLIKNLLVSIVLVLIYPVLQTHFLATPAVEELTIAGDVLLTVSIIAVIACFGNFAFTYEKSLKSDRARMYSHVTTGILMLVIGVSLEITVILTEILIGPSWVFRGLMLLLYVACTLYDHWDLERLKL